MITNTLTIIYEDKSEVIEDTSRTSVIKTNDSDWGETTVRKIYEGLENTLDGSMMEKLAELFAEQSLN